jgi:hypothetical protein
MHAGHLSLIASSEQLLPYSERGKGSPRRSLKESGCDDLCALVRAKDRGINFDVVVTVRVDLALPAFDGVP